MKLSKNKLHKIRRRKNVSRKKNNLRRKRKHENTKKRKRHNKNLRNKTLKVYVGGTGLCNYKSAKTNRLFFAVAKFKVVSGMINDFFTYKK